MTMRNEGPIPFVHGKGPGAIMVLCLSMPLLLGMSQHVNFGESVVKANWVGRLPQKIHWPEPEDPPHENSDHVQGNDSHQLTATRRSVRINPSIAVDMNRSQFCILGSDPNGVMEQLEGLIVAAGGLKLGNLPIEVEALPLFERGGDKYPLLALARQCQVLFVSHDGDHAWQAIRDDIRGIASVTIGEYRGFARQDGMIELRMVRNELRLYVNLEALRVSRLELDAVVLGLPNVEIVKR